MKQQTLARWLKIIVIGMAVCGLVIFFGLAPSIGRAHAQFWLWISFVWIAAIPCYWVLGIVWKIADEISADRSFTIENSLRVKRIMILALADSAFVFIVNVVFLFMNINHPGILLASLFICFAGVVIAVFAGCVSHLVHKAALLREENESFV
ncbi:MAG: DUF2975 domain-containing protein [Firmicutes bacterium]|nr:DUF2975 domain-containing protein [Bacillota bacterium]